MTCVCGVCTDLLPGAGHADAILHGDLGGRVGAGPGVLSEAQVVVRAQVDDVRQHPARVPGRQRGGRKRSMRGSSGLNDNIQSG